MSVFEPEQMNQAFAGAYNGGDVENLLALYERDAVLAPQPGERAVWLAGDSGHAAWLSFAQGKDDFEKRVLHALRRRCAFASFMGAFGD